jgi:hypothetical protein
VTRIPGIMERRSGSIMYIINAFYWAQMLVNKLKILLLQFLISSLFFDDYVE